MTFERLGGIILHPTSLPGGHGIGDLGPSAHAFVDFLRRAGIGLWQMLPLGPIGDSGSPYQSPSALAGNPLLVSLDRLADERLLESEDLAAAPPNADAVDFPAVAAFKDAALQKACANFRAGRCSVAFQRGFEAFVENESWLADYALFMAIRERLNGAAWADWPPDLAAGKPAARAKAEKELARDIDRHRFIQYCFFSQWRELRAYAAERRIKFVGDVPIYCALDSADVWAGREGFALDRNGRPTAVSGVPPDYFSETGQLWGNPLFRWDRMQADGFAWWLRRIRAVFGLVDVVRIDHFRGFESYWSVPAGEETAMNGEWLPGPGQAFFDALRAGLGELPIIAEDLGIITPEVDKLRLANSLPGMKVLQFAFCDGALHYRPHTYEENTVCYTATHDNDTTRGWYEAAGDDYAHMDRGAIERERDLCRRYIGRDGSSIAWDLMRLAFSSVAATAAAPMQDVLGLPNAARMNRPGRGAGQWRWRLTAGQLERAPAEGLRDMMDAYGRLPFEPGEEEPEAAPAE